MTAPDRATFGADHLARRLERARPDCPACEGTGTVATGGRDRDGCPEFTSCRRCQPARAAAANPPPHPLEGSDLYVPRGLSYGDRMPAAFQPLKHQDEIDREARLARVWRLDRIAVAIVVILGIAYLGASGLRGALDVGATLERLEARP